MALFERRGKSAVARFSGFTMQVWRDTPRKNGDVPLRLVINHPDLVDPEDPNGAGIMLNIRPTSPLRPNGTNKSYRNLDRVLSKLGL